VVIIRSFSDFLYHCSHSMPKLPPITSATHARMGALKMEDLKMEDRKMEDWKMEDRKMQDQLYLSGKCRTK